MLEVRQRHWVGQARQVTGDVRVGEAQVLEVRHMLQVLEVPMDLGALEVQAMQAGEHTHDFQTPFCIASRNRHRAAFDALYARPVAWWPLAMDLEVRQHPCQLLSASANFRLPTFIPKSHLVPNSTVSARHSSRTLWSPGGCLMRPWT